MRGLVTGAGGFLGRHAVAIAAEEGVDPVPVVRQPAGLPGERVADLADGATLDRLLDEVAPDAVLHLAGVAQHGGADPLDAAREELQIAGQLIRAAGRRQAPPRLIFLGTAAEYGDPGRSPVSERDAAAPLSTYGWWRGALGTLVRSAGTARGVSVIWVRCFNLLGPGQAPSAPVANWASQLARGGDRIELRVGSLEVVRDFLDARDAARALWRLAGADSPPALVNLCSGRGRQLRALLDTLIELRGGEVDVRVDPGLVAANAPAVVVGDPALLHAAIGDPQSISKIETSLRDVFGYFRRAAEEDHSATSR